ncbi:sugar ABC transporter substrate-binding protein [Patulibacter sp. NPDC049589]|uniref:sugar ABC transporter substrate-binding protein n=1 Tax=Patulibacter sp. NPDC049589 TaxID=3154731 RepID=UPI00342275FB
MSAATLAAGGLIGCGSGGSESASKGSAIIVAQSGTAAQKASALGEAAGKRRGTHKLPKVTIGLVQVAGQSEVAKNAENSLVLAAKQLGWTTKVCDGQGDPVKMNTCLVSLTSQNVKAAFTLAIEPSIIGAGLKLAKQKGIPVFSYGAPVAESPLFTGVYAPSFKAAGVALGKWAGKEYGAKAKTLLRLTFPGPAYVDRDSGFLEGLADAGVPGASWTASKNIDTKDLLGSAKTNTATLLQQHPNADVIYNSYEATLAGQIQATDQKFGSKQYPDRPAAITFGGALENQQDIRSGKFQASSWTNIEGGAYVALDSAARVLTGEQANPSLAGSYELEGFPVYTYKVLDKANIATAVTDGKPNPDNDFVSFFNAMWRTEYGE